MLGPVPRTATAKTAAYLMAKDSNYRSSLDYHRSVPITYQTARSVEWEAGRCDSIAAEERTNESEPTDEVSIRFILTRFKNKTENTVQLHIFGIFVADTTRGVSYHVRHQECIVIVCAPYIAIPQIIPSPLIDLMLTCRCLRHGDEADPDNKNNIIRW